MLCSEGDLLLFFCGVARRRLDSCRLLLVLGDARRKNACLTSVHFSFPSILDLGCMRGECHNHCSLPANWLVYAFRAPLEVGILILFGSYRALTLFLVVVFHIGSVL